LFSLCLDRSYTPRPLESVCFSRGRHCQLRVYSNELNSAQTPHLWRRRWKCRHRSNNEHTAEFLSPDLGNLFEANFVTLRMGTRNSVVGRENSLYLWSKVGLSKLSVRHENCFALSFTSVLFH
jgi:hypothetical protein